MSGATASDPDSDTLTYSWSISNATLCSFSNAGVLNPNLTCSDNGAFTATLTVNDAYNPAVTSNASVTVNNVRPSATFRNNGPVNEGSSINLSLTSPSDPSSVDTTTGFKYAFDCGSGYNTLSAVSNAACATNDNGMRILKGKIQDKDGGFTEYTATVMVNNVAPTVTVTGPTSGSIYPVGTPVTFAGTFTDPGILDTHTARWTFDALTAAGVVTESGGNGSVSGTYTFTIPGVYQVTLAVTDKDSGAGAASMIGALTAMVVIYDPNGGFVTGGGWIDSPIGAYLANPSLVGKANFGFMSKYQKGATVPAGETEFQFKVANFHSTSYNWLVIAGARAQYKGSGTINGVGDYAFLLTAIDGQVNGGGGVDKFRIKIWDKTTSTIIYDNQMGQGDDSNATTALGGGSIVIHQ